MLYFSMNNRCSSSGVCFLHCVFCFVKDSMHSRLAGGGEMEGGCFILCLFAFLIVLPVAVESLKAITRPTQRCHGRQSYSTHGIVYS